MPTDDEQSRSLQQVRKHQTRCCGWMLGGRENQIFCYLTVFSRQQPGFCGSVRGSFPKPVIHFESLGFFTRKWESLSAAPEGEFRGTRLVVAATHAHFQIPHVHVLECEKCGTSWEFRWRTYVSDWVSASVCSSALSLQRANCFPCDHSSPGFMSYFFFNGHSSNHVGRDTD